ncbi:MAG: coniferyl aldehyde dehydrogenase, partial [Gammaproteobacteria bacterium]
MLKDFEQQRTDFLNAPTPDLTQRKNDLRALKKLLLDNQQEIIDAISQDYGNRSKHETQFAEIITVADGINHAISHLRSWMKVQRRDIDITLFPGAKNRVIPQPLGVVGLIIPWNFPINLAFSQLIAVFAAGNRAMVKMSENSIHLSRLLKRISPDYFPATKLSFYEESGRTGIEFSKIPFDLLIFTGSGQTGRAVMAAAATNLTPVILELGGKAPAIIDPDYPLATAVERIMFVKQFNTGQICTNVDYVFVHENQVDEFARLAQKYVASHCPDIEHIDYTSIIDDKAFERLEATLDDARSKGANVINLCGQQKRNPQSRKMPLHLVLETTPNMTIRQRETFGPFLMVLPYSEPDEVINYVNRHDQPLALYPFTLDKKLAARYIDRIMSGGVSVNDALLHVAQHDLPFGGVGPSGMGHYHGREGFETFSKLRPVYYQPGFSVMKYLRPPYGSFATRVFNLLVKLKSSPYCKS